MSHPRALRLTAAAEADLTEIWTYLAVEASEAIATRFVEGIEAAFGPVRHFPGSGAPRDDLGVGLRVIVHQRYAIYYTAGSDAVTIVRVLHGARDASRILGAGET